MDGLKHLKLRGICPLSKHFDNVRSLQKCLIEIMLENLPEFIMHDFWPLAPRT